MDWYILFMEFCCDYGLLGVSSRGLGVVELVIYISPQHHQLSMLHAGETARH